MRLGVVAVIAACSGCFDPEPTRGVPCGTEAACPAGQRCVEATGLCQPDIVAAFETTETFFDEPAGILEIPIVLSRPAEGAVSVSIDLAGTATTDDFMMPALGVEFADGETRRTLSVAITDDVLDEDDETMQLSLRPPSGAGLGELTAHAVMIVDDDATPTVSFDPNEMNRMAPEGAANTSTPFMHGVVLSAPSGRPVTVEVTLTGTANTADYTVTAADLPVVIAAGATTQRIRYAVKGDATVGPSETIIMTLATPTNATVGMPSQRIHTIVNDD